MRFVRGDLHEPATSAAIGPHDVVWCSSLAGFEVIEEHLLAFHATIVAR